MWNLVNWGLAYGMLKIEFLVVLAVDSYLSPIYKNNSITTYVKSVSGIWNNREWNLNIFS